MVLGYTAPASQAFGAAGPKGPAGAAGPASPSTLPGTPRASALNGNERAKAATSSSRPPIPQRGTLRRLPELPAECRSSIYYPSPLDNEIVPREFLTTFNLK